MFERSLCRLRCGPHAGTSLVFVAVFLRGEPRLTIEKTDTLLSCWIIAAGTPDLAVDVAYPNMHIVIS